MILGVTIYSDAHTQRYYHQWPMGYRWHDTFPFGISILDFTKERVRTLPRFPTEYNIGTNSAYICDENGELMLMSNGCAVLDRNAHVIPGGEGLNPGDIHSRYCPDFYLGFHQILMLPDLVNDDYTLLIHKDIAVDRNIGRYFSPHLYYTLVERLPDNSFNVTTKNLAIRGKDAAYDQLAAIPHSNNKDWWVLENHGHHTSDYLIYIVNKDTAYLASTQSIGPSLYNFDIDGSQLVFSPDGSKLCMHTQKDGIILFDFDRTTGLLSNYRNYFEDWMINTDSTVLDGLCFSPDSRLLYISSAVDLYQLDESDPTNPIEFIIHIPRLLDDLIGWPTQLGEMHIGPDCRIYISPRWVSGNLHVIHNPNAKGISCDVEFKAITMPSLIHRKIPNYSFYHMAKEVPLCDSTIGWISTLVDFIPDLQDELFLYPNPTDGHVTMTTTFSLTNGRIDVFNATGQLVLTDNYSGQEKEMFIPGQGGVFFIKISDKNGKIISTGKVLKN